jgi:Raf kinase inhibitor-like YbhB/YbcL family protein
MRGRVLILSIAGAVLCMIVAHAPATSKVRRKNVLTVTSSAFRDGGMIPGKYTADGEDISPPLQWNGVPSNAKSFALIADDPDAPRGTWVHWVLFNWPAAEKSVPENVPPQPNLGNGAKQGTNSFGKTGYGGPAPPSGTHRYFFKVYALDTMLDLPRATKKADLLEAMNGHILAQGQIMGKYSRK